MERKENIIEVKNVSMKFNLMEEKVDTIKDYVLKIIKGQMLYNEFSALTDVSFQVKKGDILGIIGFNGAGKSTMLKILAGVLKPTAGEVVVRGSVAPLIEVGAGFDPELTARENIFLNGAILGHRREFLKEHFQEIIDFAELNQFVDVPVKNFSSGMYARLGFSIATIVQPDILIVDEVLSVGDYRFQEKCEERIKTMILRGTTVLLVSHDLSLVKNICNRVVFLQQGKLKDYGDTDIICKHYEEECNVVR